MIATLHDVMGFLNARQVRNALGWAKVMRSAASKPVCLADVQAWTGCVRVPDDVAPWLMETKWDTIRLTGTGLAVLAQLEGQGVLV